MWSDTKSLEYRPTQSLLNLSQYGLVLREILLEIAGGTRLY